MRRFALLVSLVTGAAALFAASALGVPPSNVRLTNDAGGTGYVSAYTLATGIPYTDPVLQECSLSRGR